MVAASERSRVAVVIHHVGGMTTPRFFLIDEAAAIARTSPNTIRYWIQIGRLRSTKPGRRRLIAESDLVALLQGTAPARRAPRRSP
jgi:excisionase family DNA binding protein